MIPNRLTFLELAKIAKAKGTLTDTLLRVYFMNMVRAKRKEEAALAQAALERQFGN
jgi:hypothetical protein